VAFAAYPAAVLPVLAGTNPVNLPAGISPLSFFDYIFAGQAFAVAAIS